MRFVKLAIFSLVFIFILFTAIGLLMPSSVTVLRSQTIFASKNSILSYISDLHKWHYWLNNSSAISNVHESESTNAQIKYGSYNIALIGNDSNNVTTFWRSNNGTELKSIMNISDDDKNAGASIVTWSFQQELKWYPWERLTAMLHDKILGPLMEANLLNLKQAVEKD